MSLTMRRRDGGWRSYTRLGRGQSSFQAGHGRPEYAHKEFGPGLGPPGPFTGGSSPFDHFNDRAKRILALAQDEAIRFNHNYIGTEHLLLGLIREGEGVAARALDALNVDLSKVRTAVEFIIGRGPATTSPSEITMSPRTKRVLELAVDEARKLGHSTVGSEHLLLGLVREGEGIASGVLESLGVSMEKLRHQIIATIGSSAPAGSASAAPGPAPVAREASAVRPFDRFNDRAKRVLALAQDEAIRFNHNYMGPEHLLLGLVREGEGVAAKALNSLGVELSRTRRELENLIGRGDNSASPSEITLIPRAKKVIELAIDESRLLGHSHVGTEHLLLGLVREGDGTNAGAILKAQGVDLATVRQKVIAMISGDAGPGQPS
jgi:ATP-dependent Clp protease ATP-binding subunit ClpA